MFENIPGAPNPILWLGYLTGAAASAGAAAMMVVPAAREWIYPRMSETRLRDHILFDRVLDDGVTVRCTDGTLFQVIALDGVDLSARPPDIQESLYERRRSWIEKLADLKADARIVTTRCLYDHASDVDCYSNPRLREVQHAWHSRFRESYRNRHYVVLSIRHGVDRAREELADAVKETCERLRDFRPHLLERGEAGAPSPLLSFLASMVNIGRQVTVAGTKGTALEVKGGTRRFGALDRRLADHLLFSEMMFHDGWGARREDGVAVSRDGPDEVWMAAIGVGTWGEQSSADILAQVLSVDAEMTIAHWLKVWDRTKAEAVLRESMKRTGGGSKIGNAIAGRSIQQFIAALELVSTRGAAGQSLCEHQLVVFVYGRDRDDLEYRVGLVRQAFDSFHMKAVRETASAEPLWFSLFPPHLEWVRPVKLMSSNAAHFVSFETPTQGLSSCDWGNRPVTVLRTSAGTPYSFCWHKSDSKLEVGHTLVIGPSGRGKTVLVNFLAAASLGYADARVFLIDRADGAYVAVKAFGGSYLHLQSDSKEVGEVCQLNPMHMEGLDPDGYGGGPTQWLIQWLRDFVTQCTDAESEEFLARTVRSIAGLPRQQRSLGEIYEAIPDNVAAKRELKRWVDGGEYSYLFNGATDTLAPDASRFTAFAFDRVLSDPMAARALLPYLAYRIESQMQRIGCPWLLVIDETAALIEDPAFRRWYFELLQESRKKRGVIVSCFQRAGTLRETPGTAELLIEGCPTMLLLPNEEASEAEYIDTLGCTHAEYNMVRRQHPVTRAMPRFVLLKRQEQGSVILDIDLGPLDTVLPLFHSGRSVADRLRRLEREEGSVERAVARYLGMHATQGGQ